MSRITARLSSRTGDGCTSVYMRKEYAGDEGKGSRGEIGMA